MRTNVTIDSQVIRAVQSVAGVETKAKAVMIALKEYLRWHRISQVCRYRGKLRFRPDTATMRDNER